MLHLPFIAFEGKRKRCHKLALSFLPIVWLYLRFASLVLFDHDAMSSFQIGGWLSGLLSKVMPRGPNEMILPDDSKKTVRFARFMT